jgi:hypothetical protein
MGITYIENGICCAFNWNFPQAESHKGHLLSGSESNSCLSHDFGFLIIAIVVIKKSLQLRQ